MDLLQNRKDQHQYMWEENFELGQPSSSPCACVTFFPFLYPGTPWMVPVNFTPPR